MKQLNAKGTKEGLDVFLAEGGKKGHKKNKIRYMNSTWGGRLSVRKGNRRWRVYL